MGIFLIRPQIEQICINRTSMRINDFEGVFQSDWVAVAQKSLNGDNSLEIALKTWWRETDGICLLLREGCIDYKPLRTRPVKHVKIHNWWLMNPTWETHEQMRSEDNCIYVFMNHWIKGHCMISSVNKLLWEVKENYVQSL